MVKLDDGRDYIVSLATPKNLLTLMNNENRDFLSAGDPMIMVKKLTKEVIEDAIHSYAEKDGYFLKLYAARFDIKTLNVLKERADAQAAVLMDSIEKDEYNQLEDCALIDFDINKL